MNKTMKTAAQLVLLLLMIALPILLICENHAPHAAPTAQIVPSPEAPYYVYAKGTRLEIISSDGTAWEITEIDPRTLPPIDQDALANGIIVENMYALEELLQDFS